MPRQKQSRGECAFCGREMTKGGLTKHFKTCSERQKAIEKANLAKGKKQPIYHLQIQDAYQSGFWLHLEMNAQAKLMDLDEYLRAIWLECCGHLSEFSTGDWDNEIPMRSKIGQVFKQSVKLTHIYDFGSSSETLITALNIREGMPLTKNPIYLMARNKMPETFCVECGEPSGWFCEECWIEQDEWNTFCEKHAETHPHNNYGEPMELINSPRLGMCGYEGPAEPPY